MAPRERAATPDGVGGLVVAGLLEVGWAVGLKYTEGFTRLWPTVGTAAALMASMGLLGVALKTLPLGTAYAVWTGIGTIGTALLGMLLFRSRPPPRAWGASRSSSPASWGSSSSRRRDRTGTASQGAAHPSRSRD